MKEVNIANGGGIEFVRALVCGLPSSGKTVFAASAPRPLFLSNYAEGGFNSIRFMDPTWWWDPNVPPEVRAIETITDVPKELARLEDLAVKNIFPYRTIIFDPLSIYTDQVIAELKQRTPDKDNRQIYGDLATHLRALVLRLHALPCHILWLTHVKNDGTETNGPAIGGQMGNKFPAFCDFKWMTVATALADRPTQYELRTAPYRTWTFLGGRTKLPDPLVPSFKMIAAYLQLADQPVTWAMPGFPNGPWAQSPEETQAAPAAAPEASPAVPEPGSTAATAAHDPVVATAPSTAARTVFAAPKKH